MALDKIKIVGGRTLRGEIQISGAKNASLPLMAMTLLTPEPCRITNVPALQDVRTMIDILNVLGVTTSFDSGVIDASAASLNSMDAPYDFVRKMRASVLLLGPLLARNGFARVSMPGGCAIGVRPIHLHLKAFEALGAEIHLSDGYVEAKASKLKGADFTFETVTVTGTINALMAASHADGTSTFRNCAREPEVSASVASLEQMGAQISGIGTDTLTIVGKPTLKGFDTALIPDRIETGTYLVAGAITKGDLFLRGARADHLQAVLHKLRETGAEIVEDSGGLRVRGHHPIKPIDIETAPFPGFPTDMQAQLVVLLSIANGASVVHETIFENRFMHVSELIRMGADLHVKGSAVTIKGVPHLTGAPVMATDLRASASLVLAGLAASGTTEVLRIYHLDRGYESLEIKLQAVGAEIYRVQEAAHS